MNRARAPPPPPRHPSPPPPACDELAAESHQTLRNPAQGHPLKLLSGAFFPGGTNPIFLAKHRSPSQCPRPRGLPGVLPERLEAERTRHCALSLIEEPIVSIPHQSFPWPKAGCCWRCRRCCSRFCWCSCSCSSCRIRCPQALQATSLR